MQYEDWYSASTKRRKSGCFYSHSHKDLNSECSVMAHRIAEACNYLPFCSGSSMQEQDPFRRWRFPSLNTVQPGVEYTAVIALCSPALQKYQCFHRPGFFS